MKMTTKAKNRRWYDIKAEKQNAELWLYGFVGNSIWDEINPKSLIDQLEALDSPKITVHINSEGGSVFGGNAIYNALKNHSAEIEVHIEGLAASMASVIALAGDKVYMAENALYMIHDPWSWAEGNAEQLRKSADRLDKAKETLINTYERKTGKDRDEISSMMTEETWMTATEAKEHGFIDEITEEIDLAASLKSIDLCALKKTRIPEQYQAVFNKPLPVSGNHKKEVSSMPKATNNPVDTGKDSDVELEEMQAQVKKAAADALKAEAKRREDIKAVFAPFGSDQEELKAECLDDMACSKDHASERLLAKLAEKSEPLGTSVQILEDRQDKVRRGFASAILGKVGLAKDEKSNEFRGYSLSEMARFCVESAGVSTRRMTRMEMVGTAFTHSSSDFPNVLKDVVNKTMLKGWDEAPETFEQWTNKGTLTDFRESTRPGLNTFPSLDLVPEGGEYKYGTIGDRGETIQLATYGKLVSITRQAIINDDLAAFTKIPLTMGRAARRTIGDLVYAILTSNPTMSDGTSLFHADHNNVGTGGAPTTASIDELRKLMALQTDGDSVKSGNATALGITPFAMLVPEALRGSVISIIESETEVGPSQNNPKRKNYIRNIATVISDARLDADSDVKHYMVANPAMFDTIEVAYLDGVDTPYLEQKDGWNIDGSSFKVRIDAGVKALDFRTMAYNAGA